MKKSLIYQILILASVLLAGCKKDKVETTPNYPYAEKTLVNYYSGDVVRATAMVLAGDATNPPGTSSYCKPGEKIANDLQQWVKTRKHGFNGMRISIADPWYYSRYGRRYSYDDLKTLVDQCVVNAKRVGMTVIINYHNVGEYVDGACCPSSNPDCGYEKGFGTMLEFWTEMAPHYKDDENVVFELNNEQAFNNEAYLSSEYKSAMKEVYDMVRTQAPEREIILFSFHALGMDMVNIVDTYDWIDWSKTYVGWHFYGDGKGDDAQLKREEDNLRALMASKYRTVCTEWMSPYDDADYIRPHFGYDVVSQALEEFKVAWCDWRGFNTDNTAFNAFETVIKPDAQEKGYWWVK